ncbi:MAG: GNAT family N-acetyltransferase [Bacillota bacterium]|jgi:GNAT superfamily N-acetyltransferase
MVEYRSLRAEEWPRLKAGILSFIRRHHDKHITRATYSRVRKLPGSRLNRPGTVVYTAWDGRRLVGVIICEGYGNRTSMIVVHRDYRSHGIGRRLLQLAVQQMGRFYAEVAADNLPSMKILFAMGMVAYDVFLRYGKITLRVRNGFPVERGAEEKQAAQ